MKHFILGFFTSLALIVLGALVYLRAGFAEVRADLQAPDWQWTLARATTHAAVSRRAAGVIPAMSGTDSELVVGGHLYLNGCAGCHGRPGQARDSMPLFISPPQLPVTGARYTPGEIQWIVEHGIRRSAMSAYGSFYKAEQLRALAAFVSRLPELPPSVMDSLSRK